MPKLYGLTVGDVLTGARPSHRAAAKYRLDFSGYVPPRARRQGGAPVPLREIARPLVPAQPHSLCGRRTAQLLGLTPVFQTPININVYNGGTRNYADIFATLDRVRVMASEHTLSGIRFTEPREIANANSDKLIEYSRPLDIKIYVIDLTPRVVSTSSKRVGQSLANQVPDDYFCLGLDFISGHFHPPAMQFERPKWSHFRVYPFVKAKVAVPTFCDGRANPDAVLATIP